MRTFQGAAEDVRLEGPPEGVQLAAGAIGVLASAVVAWSECVLRVTGCGLPPGPGGALGALEGVSYLAVGAVFLWSLVTKARTGSGLPAGPGGGGGRPDRLAHVRHGVRRGHPDAEPRQRAGEIFQAGANSGLEP